MTLVPGSETDLEFKTFQWGLESLTTEKLDIGLSFTHPSYISRGNMDNIQIEFFNSSLYLVPYDKTLEVIPDGFKVVVPLTTQLEDAMS